MSHPALVLLFAFAMPFIAQEPPSNVAAMRDRYRPLLVFHSGKDDQLTGQLGLLTPHSAELLDRQIVLVFHPATLASHVDRRIMALQSDEEDRDLRHRFHVHPDDFTVILLGKDGGEKFRSPTPVTIEQLTRIIDAMPMRQSEMRGKH